MDLTALPEDALLAIMWYLLYDKVFSPEKPYGYKSFLNLALTCKPLSEVALNMARNQSEQVGFSGDVAALFFYLRNDSPRARVRLTVAQEEFAITRKQLKSLPNAPTMMDAIKLAIERHGSFLEAKRTVLQRWTRKTLRRIEKFQEQDQKLEVRQRYLEQEVWRVWGVVLQDGRLADGSLSSPYHMELFEHLSPKVRAKLHDAYASELEYVPRNVRGVLREYSPAIAVDLQRASLVQELVWSENDQSINSPTAMDAGTIFSSSIKNPHAITPLRREDMAIEMEGEDEQSKSPEYKQRYETYGMYLQQHMGITPVELPIAGSLPNLFVLQALCRGEEEFPGQEAQFYRSVRWQALLERFRENQLDVNLLNYRQVAELVSVYVDYDMHSAEWVVDEMETLFELLKQEAADSQEEQAVKRRKV